MIATQARPQLLPVQDPEPECDSAPRVPRVDVVIPVYNEEHVLADSIATLHAFLSEHLPYDWRILIADNASTDATLDVARQLTDQYPRVDYLHLDAKGRGRAL